MNLLTAQFLAMGMMAAEPIERQKRREKKASQAKKRQRKAQKKARRAGRP